MRKYVGNFLKIKIENTRTYTAEECDELNKTHKAQGFDFEIKPENTQENEALRNVAKICLNRLWGKFAQRSTLNNYDFYYDYNKLLAKINNPKNTKSEVVYCKQELC